MRKISQQLLCKVTQRYQFCNILDTKITKEEWLQKEKQWNEIAQQKNAEQLNNILQSLNEHEIKRVQILADALSNLTMIEFQALFSQVNEFQTKTMGVGLTEVNSEWPAFKAAQFSSWPPQSKEDLEKAISALWDGQTMDDFKQLFGGSGGSFGADGGAPQQTAKTQAKEQKVEKKAETVQEKTNYDIELSAFDAAKKINIIKEVRQLFNLGLKDAKDLVEKAPCTLQKQAKVADAKALKEKLEAIGCTIKLL